MYRKKILECEVHITQALQCFPTFFNICFDTINFHTVLFLQNMLLSQENHSSFKRVNYTYGAPSNKTRKDRNQKIQWHTRYENIKLRKKQFPSPRVRLIATYLSPSIYTSSISRNNQSIIKFKKTIKYKQENAMMMMMMMTSIF